MIAAKVTTSSVLKQPTHFFQRARASEAGTHARLLLVHMQSTRPPTTLFSSSINVIIITFAGFKSSNIASVASIWLVRL